MRIEVMNIPRWLPNTLVMISDNNLLILKNLRNRRNISTPNIRENNQVGLDLRNLLQHRVRHILNDPKMRRSSKTAHTSKSNASSTESIRVKMTNQKDGTVS